MKVSLTPLQWIAVGGMVAIALLGGGAVFYFASQLSGVEGEIESRGGELSKLTAGRYYPDQANIDALTKGNEALQGALDALKETLLAPGNKLALVEEKNPVVFKQELAEEIHSLADLAAKKGVRVEPGASYFGFAVYQNNNPTEKATRILGKQLVGIGETVRALCNAPISSLEAVRRTFDENPNAAGAPASPGGGGAASEVLRGKIVTPEGGHYTVYPLEFEFTCSEEGLRAALANLSHSPYVLIIRTLNIASKRTAPPRLEDLAASVQSSAAGKKPPTFLVAMGDDPVHVRARIDLVEWTGKAEPAAPAPAAPARRK